MRLDKSLKDSIKTQPKNQEEVNSEAKSPPFCRQPGKDGPWSIVFSHKVFRAASPGREGMDCRHCLILMKEAVQTVLYYMRKDERGIENGVPTPIESGLILVDIYFIYILRQCVLISVQ